MKIGIVVLHFQDIVATLSCIDSIRSQTNFDKMNYTVVIVDNDALIENNQLKEKIEQYGFHYLTKVKNLGFGQGMNLGATWLKENDSCDYYWFLNNDIWLPENSLKKLYKSLPEFKHKKIIGPTIIFSKKLIVQCNGGCKYNSWIGIDLPNRKASCIKKENQFDYIYGAAMITETKFFHAVNGFSKNYFLYFEELELASHCDKDELAWAKEVQVKHVGSNSSFANNETKYLCTYHAALSCFKYTKLHHPNKLISVLIFRLLGNLARSLIYNNSTYFMATKDAIQSFTRKNAK